jgi:diguanylate cyclase (GGDEF)-like protein
MPDSTDVRIAHPECGADTANEVDARAHSVLIVDDDAAVRAVLTRILAAAGFTCTQANDGDDGVRLALSTRPDVILLDLAMPRLGGLEALAHIRSDFHMASTPVIFLTGNGHVDSIVAHLGAGGDDYLVKPVRGPELIARVQLALRRAEQLRDLNPLTGLPGNASILREIGRRLGADTPLACLYVDVDNFKSYNDRYGFARGDLAITGIADAVMSALDSLASTDHFVGHVGGDDFVVVTVPEVAERVAQAILERCDRVAPSLYNGVDRQRGWISTEARDGRQLVTPLMSVSIGIARTDTRRLGSPAEVAAVASEMKAYAKRQSGSSYAIDRRS